MAGTPSRTGSPATHDADLIIIGGGPAGCAAARMAADVGTRSVLIEPDALCRNLYRIPALNNVLGGYTSGPALADSITAELKSTELCRLELGRRVVELHADHDHVAVSSPTRPLKKQQYVRPGRRPGSWVAPIRALGQRIHPMTGREVHYIACRAMGSKAFVVSVVELAELAWVAHGDIPQYILHGILTGPTASGYGAPKLTTPGVRHTGDATDSSPD